MADVLDPNQVRRDTISLTAKLHVLSQQLLKASNALTASAETLEENHGTGRSN